MFPFLNELATLSISIKIFLIIKVLPELNCGGTNFYSFYPSNSMTITDPSLNVTLLGTLIYILSSSYLILKLMTYRT